MTSRTGLWFVLPALVTLAVLIAFPVAYTAVLSVTDDAGRFVGIDNFRSMAGSRLTALAVWNTVVFVGGSIVAQIVIGTVVGILLNQPLRGQGVVRAIVLLPWVVPGVVAATTWAWMLHPEFGIVNYLAEALSFTSEPVGWLTNPDLVMPAVTAINVWKLFPFVAVMVLAGLQGVPPELYEAARVDGASLWDEVRHVMLPHLRPVLAALTLLLTIWGLNAITIIYTVTRGGPANRTLTVPIHIFRHGFEAFEFHETAALSMMFFLVTLSLVGLYVRVTGTGGTR